VNGQDYQILTFLESKWYIGVWVKKIGAVDD